MDPPPLAIPYAECVVEALYSSLDVSSYSTDRLDLKSLEVVIETALELLRNGIKVKNEKMCHRALDCLNTVLKNNEHLRAFTSDSGGKRLALNGLRVFTYDRHRYLISALLKFLEIQMDHNIDLKSEYIGVVRRTMALHDFSEDVKTNGDSVLKRISLLLPSQ